MVRIGRRSSACSGTILACDSRHGQSALMPVLLVLVLVLALLLL